MQVLVAVLLALAGVANVAAFRMPVARTNSMPSFASSVEMLVDTNIFSSPKAVPPSNFLDCVRQAAQGAKKAIADGYKLVEVEFPPLPLEFLEDSSSSARDIADANTRWAIEFSRTFVENGLVSIIYPDQPELDDAINFVDKEGGANPFPNVTLATIRSDSIRNAGSLDQILMSVFGATVGGTVEAVENTKMYIALISSTQELPDLEKLHNLDPSIPLVFFNLRLDILVRDWDLIRTSLPTLLTAPHLHAPSPPTPL
jgi:hypothetical protein